MSVKYVTVRTYGRNKTRNQRTSALPISSVLFVLCLLLLSLYYNYSPPSTSISSDSSHSSSATEIAQNFFGTARNTDTDGESDGYGGLCTKGQFTEKWHLAFLIPGVIFAFVGLAIVTDDYFVSALEQICVQLSLSEDVAGATFMAAGSSTPEFFASLLGVFLSKDEVGLGTIVGSAVFNLLVIIGLSSALAGAVLKLDWRPLLRDSSFYLLSVLLLLLFSMGTTKGRINWWEGLVLVLTYVVYVLFMAYGNKPYMKWASRFIKTEIAAVDIESGSAFPAALSDFQPTLEDSHMPSYARSTNSTSDPNRRYRDLNPRTRLKVAQIAVIAANRIATASPEKLDERPNVSEVSQPDDDSKVRTIIGIPLPTNVLGWLFFPLSFPWRFAFRLTIIDCSAEKRNKWWPATFVLSIIWISGISYIMVEAARISGCLLGIPAAAMGLTVLAAGTSVPDALASISVARDGAGDMAVSNAIGSNVFDILLGLGVPWFLGDLILKSNDSTPPITISVEPITKVVVPIIILMIILVVFVTILILLKWRMSPFLGYLLLGLYVLFVTYTLLDVFVLGWSSH